jgi:hypothetical protein
MPDTGRTKLLYTAATEGEAQMLVDHLASFEITASAQGGALSFARGDIPLTQQTLPQVWVFERDYADAMQVLDAWVAENADDEPGEDWNCPACGERIEGNFDQCWSCGGARPPEDGDETT